VNWEEARLVDEVPVSGQSQPYLFDQPGGTVDFDDRDRSLDELIAAGWDPSDHGDPETDPDDTDAWFASLPPDIQAELTARPPVTAPPCASAAAARAAFADGGVCDAMPPGWYLGRVMTEATLDGYSDLTDDQLAGVLRACQRQISAGYAELAWAVGEVAGRRIAGSRRPGWSGLADHVTDELAAELTLTGRSARRLLDVAAGLRRLPEVYRELLTGAIDWPRACVFVDELSVLDEAAARQVSERLADRAAGWTTGQLRAALARAVLAADPGAAERRKSAARQETRVETWREPSGNATLAGRELPPAEVMAADAQLTADADWLRAGGVPGTLAELRALAYLARLSDRDLATLLPPSTASTDCDPDAGRGRGGRGGRGAADVGASGCGGGADDRCELSDGDPCESAHGGPGNGHLGNGDLGSGDPGNGAPDSCGTDGASCNSGAGGARVGSVHLTVPLATLAGLSESPAEVAGYGPVDSRDARQLAGMLARDPATRWCLTVTGGDGTAVAHACARRGPRVGEPVIGWAAGLRERLVELECGTCRHGRQAAGYVPPPRLRHLVMVRQRRCAFPGCRRPARLCDLDHTTPFESGGPTCECNLAPLCRRHHRAKQAPRWQLTQHLPGHMTWRLPSGRTYSTTGDPYPV
jgi:hypothetical protein